MNDLNFFPGIVPLPLAIVAGQAGVSLPDGIDTTRLFHAVAPLDRAGPADVAMASDVEAETDLRFTRAGACLVTAKSAHRLPATTIALVTDTPTEAFARIAALLHPDSVRPGLVFQRIGIDPAAIIHGQARLETGVSIDPGAIVGPRVEIGTGTTIGANVTIAAGVRIGRHCAIDSQVCISHALIGDRVVIHAGARIGQGTPGRATTLAPRLGRVIIQNDVEVGANATIARGSLEDTVLGEGCRIGTAVSIAPDTRVARNAVHDAG